MPLAGAEPLGDNTNRSLLEALAGGTQPAETAQVVHVQVVHVQVMHVQAVK